MHLKFIDMYNNTLTSAVMYEDLDKFILSRKSSIKVNLSSSSSCECIFSSTFFISMNFRCIDWWNLLAMDNTFCKKQSSSLLYRLLLLQVNNVKRIQLVII